MKKYKNFIFITIFSTLTVISLYLLITASHSRITKIEKIETGNLPPLGDPSAPVQIIEFGDYLCPFCAQASMEFEKEFGELIKQGKIAFYFRDFLVHPQADVIANSARCANEQNKFWEYHKALFQKFLNQENINSQETWLNLANELNLNKEEFEKCLNEKRYLNNVYQDTQDGLKKGVRATPTFFLQNNKKAFKIEGWNVKNLRSIINQLLNQ